MTSPAPRSGSGNSGSSLDDLLATFLAEAAAVPAYDLEAVVDMAGAALSATRARMLVADYGLTSLQELGERVSLSPPQPIEGTMAGRCFASSEIVVSAEHDPLRVWVPLTEGSERLGVLELTHPTWSDEHARAADVVARILVLVLVSKRRYSDIVLRSRRSEPLSLAAEIQWALLPPLTCTTDEISASGILEPAYSIGGDSFDYALNSIGLEFAIVDAVGHGLPAVSISTVAVNGLRNARREGHSLERAYLDTDAALRAQFNRSAYSTGQIGTLNKHTGELTWLNAGHPLPLLVRDRTFIGELVCHPSLPMGLDGPVAEVAVAHLQPGDRVLFHTDGIMESRSPDGEVFGMDRLADMLVRAATDETSPAETVRRLAEAVLDFNGRTLRDDATFFLLEYHGRPTLRSGRRSASQQPRLDRPVVFGRGHVGAVGGEMAMHGVGG